MESAVDKIIEALGTLNGPMQDLWAIALRANYAVACIYLIVALVLVVFQVWLWKYRFPEDSCTYDEEIIVPFLWVGRIGAGIASMVFLGLALYRFIAPEMATLSDIGGAIGGVL